MSFFGILFFNILILDIIFSICYTVYMKNVYRTHEALLFKNDFVDWITGKLLDPIETQNYFILQVAECNYNNSFSTNEHIQHCDLEITFPVTNSLF